MAMSGATPTPPAIRAMPGSVRPVITRLPCGPSIHARVPGEGDRILFVDPASGTVKGRLTLE